MRQSKKTEEMSKQCEPLKVMAAESEIARLRSGVDPETLEWPKCMPERHIEIRKHRHNCVRHFKRFPELMLNPRRSACPCCGQLVPVDQLICEAYYDSDSMRPWASWIAEKVFKCSQCGDKHHDLTGHVIWREKPQEWDTLVFSKDADPHSAPPVEIACVAEADPERE